LPSAASILLRWLTLLAGVCFVVGAAGAGFLHALAWVGRTFEAHLWLVWTLPFLGLAMTWIYARLTPGSAGGVRTLLGQIRQPGDPLPLAMAPAIVGTTLLSHLGGASVGREGTALQMGGGLADLLGRFGQVIGEERRTLLLCGISAGFGAVFGTPFAAAVFALEFVRLSTGWWYRLPLALICALGADQVGRHCFGVVHGDYRLILPPTWEVAGFVWAAVLGIVCGLVARFYLRWVTHNPDWKPQGLLGTPYRAIFAFGVLYAGLIWCGGLEDFTGLSLGLVDSAAQHPMHPLVPCVKLILTALCVGAGFRGGEVTPLFVIGATLGSALADYTSLPVSVAAALGFVGVFAGAGAVPLACTVMACEVFDPALTPFAALACGASWLVAGRRGLYSE
jgi:H+/Cl- antiporter ClcA